MNQPNVLIWFNYGLFCCCRSFLHAIMDISIAKILLFQTHQYRMNPDRSCLVQANCSRLSKSLYHRCTFVFIIKHVGFELVERKRVIKRTLSWLAKKHASETTLTLMQFWPKSTRRTEADSEQFRRHISFNLRFIYNSSFYLISRVHSFSRHFHIRLWMIYINIL